MLMTVYSTIVLARAVIYSLPATLSVSVPAHHGRVEEAALLRDSGLLLGLGLACGWLLSHGSLRALGEFRVCWQQKAFERKQWEVRPLDRVSQTTGGLGFPWR